MKYYVLYSLNRYGWMIYDEVDDLVSSEISGPFKDRESAI